MQTLTIDIINEKAVLLIHDLELLELIKIRKEKYDKNSSVNWAVKYKGAMSKQTTTIIESQLNELRNEWE